jgi:hypothetical protein
MFHVLAMSAILEIGRHFENSDIIFFCNTATLRDNMSILLFESRIDSVLVTSIIKGFKTRQDGNTHVHFEKWPLHMKLMTHSKLLYSKIMLKGLQIS